MQVMSLLRATLVSGDFTLHLLLGLFWRTSLQNTSGQLLLKFFTRRLSLRFSYEGKGKYPIFGNVLHWYYKKYLLELKKKNLFRKKLKISFVALFSINMQYLKEFTCNFLKMNKLLHLYLTRAWLLFCGTTSTD